MYLLKTASLWRWGMRRRIAFAAFLFAWPGVVASHFAGPRRKQSIDASRFLSAWARMATGVLSTLLLAIYAPRLSGQALGLGGMAALLLTVHLGIADLLPWLLRWVGFDVPLLFDRPWAASSLHGFWSRRWNVAFIEMNRVFFLRRFYRHFGRRTCRFLIFGLSGILHELVLSVPALGGWGLPFGHFVLHGLLCEVEERFRIRGRIWTLFWIVTPRRFCFTSPSGARSSFRSISACIVYSFSMAGTGTAPMRSTRRYSGNWSC